MGRDIAVVLGLRDPARGGASSVVPWVVRVLRSFSSGAVRSASAVGVFGFVVLGPIGAVVGGPGSGGPPYRFGPLLFCPYSSCSSGCPPPSSLGASLLGRRLGWQLRLPVLQGSWFGTVGLVLVLRVVRPLGVAVPGSAGPLLVLAGWPLVGSVTLCVPGGSFGFLFLPIVFSPCLHRPTELRLSMFSMLYMKVKSMDVQYWVAYMFDLLASSNLTKV